MKRREKQLGVREEAVTARERAADVKERESWAQATQIIEAAHVEAEKVASGAEKLRAETQAECLNMSEVAHEERRKIGRFIKRVRDVVVRIGSALGLDLLGKDLMRDLASIEEDLAEAEPSQPKGSVSGF